jgi:ABC-type transport system involved in Fe-S cluster assembly fused permease/ATPase subunit
MQRGGVANVHVHVAVFMFMFMPVLTSMFMFMCVHAQALDRAMQPSEADGTHPRTVLVIAHRLSTVRNAHTIVALDKGKVGGGWGGGAGGTSQRGGGGAGW